MSQLSSEMLAALLKQQSGAPTRNTPAPEGEAELKNKHDTLEFPLFQTLTSMRSAAEKSLATPLTPRQSVILQPIILNLIADNYVEFLKNSSESFPTLAGEKSKNVEYRDAKTPSASAQINEAIANPCLEEMNTILNGVPKGAPPTQQAESVVKLRKAKQSHALALFQKASPVLLQTATLLRNTKAMLWLLSEGAEFPLEFKLMLSWSTPKLYTHITSLIETYRNKDAFFLCFRARYAEEVKRTIEEGNKKKESKKEASITLKSQLTKCKENLSEIYDNLINVMRGQALKSSASDNVELTLEILKKINDIVRLSVIDTKASITFLQDCFEKNENFIVYYYHKCLATREKNLKIIQEKFNDLPESLQVELASPLSLEKALRDTSFQKILNFLEQHHTSVLQTYREQFGADILPILGQPEHSSKLSEINQHYLKHLTETCSTLVRKTKDDLENVLTDFPRIKAANPLLKKLDDIYIHTEKGIANGPFDTFEFFIKLHLYEKLIRAVCERIQQFVETLKETTQDVEIQEAALIKTFDLIHIPSPKPAPDVPSQTSKLKQKVPKDIVVILQDKKQLKDGAAKIEQPVEKPPVEAVTVEKPKLT